MIRVKEPHYTLNNIGPPDQMIKLSMNLCHTLGFQQDEAIREYLSVPLLRRRMTIIITFLSEYRGNRQDGREIPSH